MERFADYMLAKRGMADALPAILAAREGLRAHSRQALGEAVQTLLTAGIDAGLLQAGLSAGDVLMALGGITLIAEHEHQPELARRLIALLIGGLADRGAG